MRPVHLMPAAGLLLALAAPLAHAGDLFVVANASVNLSADELREVYLGDKQFAGSVKLVPLDNSALQADFLAKVVKVDGARYASVWSKKGFREGLTPPAAKGSDGEVLAAVKANPGSVGYVSKPSPDVKVLLKL